MKINLSKEFLSNLENDGFTLKYGTVGDTDCVLIIGEITAKIYSETRMFRSSIWTLDGNLVSASYPKFWNMTEKPNICPDPDNTQLKNAYFPEKIDGSTLIVSKYNGELIIRTRGTFDATKLDNGFEIEELKNKYPAAFDNNLLNSEKYSLIYEWVSSINQIVLSYENTPDIYLTGVILHDDYKMLSQLEVNNVANIIGVKRPTLYSMRKNSLTELTEIVKNWQGKEGVCVYYPVKGWPYWEIKKLKSLEYLRLHSFKSDMTIEKLLDIYIENRFSAYNDLCDYIIKTFDYECFEYAKNWVSCIYDAKKYVDMFLAHSYKFIDNIKFLSRKDQAIKILSSYGKTNKSSILFTMLDNKPLSNQQLKTLYLQYL